MAKIRRNLSPTRDVLIVGGSYAGLALATSLGAAGLRVTCLERRPATAKPVMTPDGRTLALSFRSMQLLRASGVAPLIAKDACPILDIRVADQNSALHLDFRHSEVGANPFGWIIENRLFGRALERRARQLKTVQIVAGAKVKNIEADDTAACVTLADGRAFKAPLVVGADGRKSICRALTDIPVYGWDYGQTAIVCAIRHTRPHENVAVEHFLPGGPFATLPMTKGRSGIVWTETTAAAATLMQMSDHAFTHMLQEKVADYLGKITLAGPRQAHALQFQRAERYTAPRLALIGDAAHGIHPIAGQGFNLGMGDIGALTEELLRAKRLGLDLGAPDLLQRYEKRRAFDNGNMALATDWLDRLFSNAIPPVQAARRFGLGAVHNMPRLRRFFIRTAMGEARQA